jgi:hypothetical protein
MAYSSQDQQKLIYRIRVSSVMDEKWAEWFDHMTLELVGENETQLTGPVIDQTALHGILAKIGELGLVLLSVEFIKEEDIHEHSRDKPDL